MQFNPDPNKHVNENILSCKLVSNNLSHPHVELKIMILLDVLVKNIWELSLILVKKLKIAIKRYVLKDE